MTSCGMRAPRQHAVLTKGWSLSLGAQHQWNANLKTSLWGDYGRIEYSQAASTVLSGAAVSAMIGQLGSVADWLAHGVDAGC